MPIENSSESLMFTIFLAMALYGATYLSFVWLLRYPRNWRPIALPHAMLTATLMILTAAFASVSHGRFEPVTFLLSLGIITALFTIVAAPAIAFRPAAQWVEFLARHGNHAGLWIIVPAAIIALATPNVGLLGLLVAITLIELAWFVRHSPTNNRQLYPIVGHDLAVLTAQASGNIEAFSRQHGIDELVVSNGAVQWRGCATDTLPCPFNFYINRLGLNTAPCCRAHMGELCHSVAAWLRELEIDHWIEGGTLLGAVRENGRILAWEDDVDLSVLLGSGMSFKSFAVKLSEYGIRDGFHVDTFANKRFITVSYDRPRKWPFSWERNRMRGEIRLDLAVYRHGLNNGKAVLERMIAKGAMPSTENGCYGVPREIVLPTAMIDFAGGKIGCPNRSKEYLKIIYGDIGEIAYTYLDDAAANARRGVDEAENA